MELIRQRVLCFNALWYANIFFHIVIIPNSVAAPESRLAGIIIPERAFISNRLLLWTRQWS